MHKIEKECIMYIIYRSRENLVSQLMFKDAQIQNNHYSLKAPSRGHIDKSEFPPC